MSLGSAVGSSVFLDERVEFLVGLANSDLSWLILI